MRAPAPASGSRTHTCAGVGLAHAHGGDGSGGGGSCRGLRGRAAPKEAAKLRGSAAAAAVWRA